MAAIITIPGKSRPVAVDSKIDRSSYFTWGEALHDGSRIPQSWIHTSNIIQLASALEMYRRELGRPMHVTSWYRPEPWNSRAGGVPNSMHLVGSAIDFWVEGRSGSQLFDLAMALSWPGGVGRYANHPDLCHLDLGAKRQWG